MTVDSRKMHYWFGLCAPPTCPSLFFWFVEHSLIFGDAQFLELCVQLLYKSPSLILVLIAAPAEELTTA